MVDGFRRRVPGIISRNFRLKALSLGLAIVAWTAVVYASNPPDSQTVDLTVASSTLPVKYILASPLPALTVRVRGTRDHLAAFNSSSLTVTAAFDRVDHPGLQDVPVTVTNADPNVELDSPPASIRADIDVLTSVAVPLQLSIQRPLPPGYQLGAVTFTPEKVSLSGPSRRLTGLSAAVNVDLADTKTNFVAQADVILHDVHGAQVSNVEVHPNSVTVKIAVSSNLVARASAVVPDLTGTVGTGRVLSSVTVSPPSVVLTGPQDVLNSLSSVSTTPVSLAGVLFGNRYSVKIVVPDGVTAEPDTVRVTITTSPIATQPPPSAPPTQAPTPAPTPTPTGTPHP